MNIFCFTPLQDNSASTSMVAVIVGAVLVALVLVVAALLMGRKGGGQHSSNTDSAAAISFENPMYSSANDDDGGGNGGGYMDVPAGSADGTSGYMDVPAGSGAGAGAGGSDQSSYVDVQGLSGGANGEYYAAGTSGSNGTYGVMLDERTNGYMDTAPSAAQQSGGGGAGYMDVGGIESDSGSDEEV
jgi:hypothetical protein